MSDATTISALELENVKRVRALRLDPSPEGLTVVGGRNAQGKTSVLDAIAWALGGNKMRPNSPNRDGAASPARIRVELSNGIVVERKGKNGALHVTDARGMRGGQALLDAFVGQLALDLPKFMGATDRQRADYLLGIIGVSDELARLDAQIKSTFEERRDVGRDADRLRKAAESMPGYPEAPEDFVDITELTDQMQEKLLRNSENRRRRDELAHIEADADHALEAMADLSRRIRALEAERDELTSRHVGLMADLEAARKEVSGLRDEDVSGIEKQIRSAHITNEWVQANRNRAKAACEAKAMEAERDELTKRLEDLRTARTALLDDAGLPLDGLAVEDGTLYFRGHVWGDMSGAEQLRVATAIVRATKPECGFVLVDKLEQFDTDQLAEFARWCEGEGLQVIGTRVATDDSCTVVIEDGRIVGQEMGEAPAPNPRGEAIPWGDEF